MYGMYYDIFEGLRDDSKSISHSMGRLPEHTTVYYEFDPRFF